VCYCCKCNYKRLKLSLLSSGYRFERDQLYDVIMEQRLIFWVVIIWVLVRK